MQAHTRISLLHIVAGMRLKMQHRVMFATAWLNSFMFLPVGLSQKRPSANQAAVSQ